MFLKRPRITIKDVFINFSIFFISFLIIILILEVGCSLFYDEKQNLGAEAKRGEGFFLNDANGGKYKDKYVDQETSLLKRMSNHEVVLEQYSKINPQKHPKNKPADKFRVVILGDSFTGGGGVGPSEGFADVLKKRFDGLELSNNKELEVLIFCEAGFNTEQEYFLFKELALQYEPDIFILQYCDNDIAPKRTALGKKGNAYIRSKTDFFIFEDTFVPLLPVLEKDINRWLLKNSAFARFVSYKLNIIVNKDQLDEENSFSYIRKMNKTLKDQQTPFFIINLPLAFEDLCDKNNDFAPFGPGLHKKLASLASQEEIFFLNLCDYIDNLLDHASPRGGGHYDVETNILVADILEKEIEGMLRNNSLLK
jgi:lysophospholipase L1-like esterase